MSETIYQVIAKITTEIPAIPKNGRYTDANGRPLYPFRRADDIIGTIAPICTRHGLMILPPEVVSHESVTAGKMRLVTMRLRYRIILAADPTQEIVTDIIAEAADNSDKAVAKAYTYGKKILFAQLFHVTDVDHDEERPDVGGAIEREQHHNAFVAQVHGYADRVRDGDPQAMRALRGWVKQYEQRIRSLGQITVVPWYAPDGDEMTVSAWEYATGLGEYLSTNYERD